MNAVAEILEFLRLHWVVLVGLVGIVWGFANMKRDIAEQKTSNLLVINKLTENRITYETELEKTRSDFAIELQRVKDEHARQVDKIERVDALLFGKLDNIIHSVSEVRVVVGKLEGHMYAQDSKLK